HLLHRAVDGIADQLFVPLPASQRMIDLGDDPAFRIVAVGVDRGDGADASRRRPGARTQMVGRRNAFAALYQGQHFTARIKDRPDTLEHQTSETRLSAYRQFTAATQNTS